MDTLSHGLADDNDENFYIDFDDDDDDNDDDDEYYYGTCGSVPN